METTFKEIKIPDNAFREVQGKKGKEIHNPCCICGREVNLKRGGMVHMTTDGTFTTAPDDSQIDNSQGFFPIGPECKKLLPKEFIFKEI